MFRRRKRRDQDRIEQGPVVFDTHGMPIGVALTPRTEETTRAGRHHAQLEGLRRTRELDLQFRLRSQTCIFCSPPPS